MIRFCVKCLRYSNADECPNCSDLKPNTLYSAEAEEHPWTVDYWPPERLERLFIDLGQIAANGGYLHPEENDQSQRQIDRFCD